MRETVHSCVYRAHTKIRLKHPATLSYTLTHFFIPFIIFSGNTHPITFFHSLSTDILWTFYHINNRSSIHSHTHPLPSYVIPDSGYSRRPPQVMHFSYLYFSLHLFSEYHIFQPYSNVSLTRISQILIFLCFPISLLHSIPLKDLNILRALYTLSLAVISLSSVSFFLKYSYIRKYLQFTHFLFIRRFLIEDSWSLQLCLCFHCVFSVFTGRPNFHLQKYIKTYRKLIAVVINTLCSSKVFFFALRYTIIQP